MVGLPIISLFRQWSHVRLLAMERALHGCAPKQHRNEVTTTPCPTCVCSQSDYLDYRAHHSGASSFPRLITLLPPSICHLFARVHSRAPSLAVCFAGLAIFGELRTRDFASWRLMGRIRALSRQFWRCHGAISFSCSTKQQEVRL
jgi:hypothetical protein